MTWAGSLFCWIQYQIRRERIQALPQWKLAFASGAHIIGGIKSAKEHGLHLNLSTIRCSKWTLSSLGCYWVDDHHALQEDSLKISCLPPTGPFVLCRYSFRQSPVTPVRGHSIALKWLLVIANECSRILANVARSLHLNLRFLPAEGAFSSGIPAPFASSFAKIGCSMHFLATTP